MRVEKKSRATVALVAAGLLLGVLTIVSLQMKLQSNQVPPTQPLQSQAAEQPNNEIDTTRPPVIAAGDVAAEQPVAPVAPAAQPAPVDPAAVLSIAGAVLNQQGDRLADIEIIALPRRVFTNENDKETVEQRTTSDAAGWLSICAIRKL